MPALPKGAVMIPLSVLCSVALRDGAEIIFSSDLVRGARDPETGWREYSTSHTAEIRWNNRPNGFPSALPGEGWTSLEQVQKNATATEEEIAKAIFEHRYQPPVFGGVSAVRRSLPAERGHFVPAELSREETNLLVPKVGSFSEGKVLRDPKVKGILAGRWVVPTRYPEEDSYFIPDRTILQMGRYAFAPCPICRAERQGCDRGRNFSPLPCPECGHI